MLPVSDEGAPAGLHALDECVPQASPDEVDDGGARAAVRKELACDRARQLAEEVGLLRTAPLHALVTHRREVRMDRRASDEPGPDEPRTLERRDTCLDVDSRAERLSLLGRELREERGAENEIGETGSRELVPRGAKEPATCVEVDRHLVAAVVGDRGAGQDDTHECGPAAGVLDETSDELRPEGRDLLLVKGGNNVRAQPQDVEVLLLERAQPLRGEGRLPEPVRCSDDGERFWSADAGEGPRLGRSWTTASEEAPDGWIVRRAGAPCRRAQVLRWSFQHAHPRRDRCEPPGGRLRSRHAGHPGVSLSVGTQSEGLARRDHGSRGPFDPPGKTGQIRHT